MSCNSDQASTPILTDSQSTSFISAQSTETSGQSDQDVPRCNGNKLASSKDAYCWLCHKDKCNISCKLCPRSFHFKCLPSEYLYLGQTPSEGEADNKSLWVCLECSTIMKSEDLKTRSSALRQMSPYQFSQLLMYALGTIKAVADLSFHQPVSDALFPDYKNYIINPMDFSTIEKNIRKNIYGCTESLIVDVKLIVHNCYIYNGPNHPLTKNALYFSKVAKTEMNDIEICPNCFQNYYSHPDNWFEQPCSKPHILVDAKLRGYPPWPAKAVQYNKDRNEVDVRFFGAHDRSWVPVDSCTLLTEPNASKHRGSKTYKSTNYQLALNELKRHIQLINTLFPNKFSYAKGKQSINVNKLFICEPNQEDASQLCDSEDKEGSEEGEKLVIDESIDDNDGPDKNFVSHETNEENDKSYSKSENVLDEATLSGYQGASYNNEWEELTPKKQVKRKRKSNDDLCDDQKTNNLNCPKKIKIKTYPIKGIDEYKEELDHIKKKLEFKIIMHQQELQEVKHNFKLTMCEMQESWKNEKEKALRELKNSLEIKYKKEIEEVKRKQWCAECSKEAIYFCCWNTSYCSYDCQSLHWPNHALECQQQKPNTNTTTNDTGDSTIC